MAKFEMEKDVKGEWRWHFRADNGRIVADSAEGYHNEDDCRHGIEIVKTQAQNAPIV
jgi:hypothetical protein